MIIPSLKKNKRSGSHKNRWSSYWSIISLGLALQNQMALSGDKALLTLSLIWCLESSSLAVLCCPSSMEPALVFRAHLVIKNKSCHGDTFIMSATWSSWPWARPRCRRWPGWSPCYPRRWPRWLGPCEDTGACLNMEILLLFAFPTIDLIFIWLDRGSSLGKYTRKSYNDNRPAS